MEPFYQKITITPKPKKSDTIRKPKETVMKKALAFAAVAAISLTLMSARQIRTAGPETIVPPSLLRAVIDEASGEMALQNEIVLTGVNRNRLPGEYIDGYFETESILAKLKEYGISQSEIIDLPARSKTTWDAEMAELWLTRPEPRKLADLDEMPAALCSGSATTDTTAALVYVGPGFQESDYQGKDVKDKIVLVNGEPEMARRLAVEKFGAKGLIGYSSSHPEWDPDQVGWSSVRVGEKEKPTFGFMISTRQGEELRNALEQGTPFEVRAVCRTRQVPYKEQLVSALLPGDRRPNEELVFTAHLFEGFAKQGANDDASGCAAILETARTLRKLIDDGRIPPLKRSIRFLFVPEISGTAAYIEKYPEVARRFFANINEDMVGEDLVKNRSLFNLENSPGSLPSYLGDVLESIVRWMGETQKERLDDSPMIPVVSPTGTRAPFYYAVTRFVGGSDHIVFVDGGVRVPAVMFICWPDMWYHTSGDTPDKSDATQLKRVVVIGAAAAAFLANAGPEDAPKIIAETSGRGLARLGLEKLRAEKMVSDADAKGLAEARKEALNLIDQAFAREKETVLTCRFFADGDSAVEALVKSKAAALDIVHAAFVREVEDVYKLQCRRTGLTPQKPALTDEEVGAGRLVPVRTDRMKGYFNAFEFYKKMREMAEGAKSPPAFSRLGRAEFEVRNFIDGRRSVLDIRNAVAAEYGPLPVASVQGYLEVLKNMGYIDIVPKNEKAGRK
jgi:aminopeptidase YwaD